MGWAALLFACAMGAGASATLSVFGFMAALTLIAVAGGIMAAIISGSIGDATLGTLALFGATQVGYVLGMAVLSRVLVHRSPDRRGPRDRTPRPHFRIRK